MRWSISTRIFLGFAAIIFAFGVVGLFGVWQMQQLRRNVQLERRGILPLASELAKLQRDVTGYEKELAGTSESDLLRLQTFFPNFKPFEGVVRVEQLARGIGDKFDLDDVERELLDHIAEQLKRLRTEPDLRDSLEGSAGPVVRAVLRESAEAGQSQQLYEAIARAFVGRLHEGKLAEARALKDVLAMIVRRTKNGLAGVQREARKLIAEVDQTAQARESQTLIVVSVATGFALVCAIIIMIWAGLTLRPLRQLGEGARRVARGDFTAVRVDSRDEIGQLAVEFNRMATSLAERDRLLARQGEELLRSERLATIGKMSSQITHEIRNPLSSIGLNTELLEDELVDFADGSDDDRIVEARDLLGAIRAEIDRLTGVTEQYLRFARLPRPDLELRDLNSAVGDLVTFLQGEFAAHDAAAELQLAPDLPEIPVDVNQIRQAVLNLLRNGLEAFGDRGGRITIRTEPDRGDGGHVRGVLLSVQDDGPGIDAETVEHIFDPFFSTKDTGTGLGLALVQQIVQEHGGQIECDSTPAVGTTFRIWLPADAA